MTLTFFKPFLIFSLMLLFFSCTQKKENSFKLPKGIKIDNTYFLNPLYVDDLFSDPNRIESVWNNTILKDCKIREIEIKKTAKEKSKEGNIKIVYTIDTFGNPIQFCSYDGLNKVESKSKYFYSKNHLLDSIDVIKLYGTNSKNILRVKHEEKTSNLIYDKNSNKPDESIYHFNNGKLQIIIQKVSGVITRIDFIMSEGTAMSKLKELTSNFSIGELELNYAEKNIIYMKNGLPVSAYSIGSEWNQLDLVKEWKYEGKKLINYQEFVNRILVKNMSFQYTSDNILQTILYNKENYSFTYK